MGCTHENISCEIIINSEVTSVLKKYGIKPHLVADHVSGKGELGKIISSEIDLDRMDYLVRDSYYAGVAYGVIDVERIISGMRIKNRRIVVDEDSLEAVELLLISRNMMYETVYRHHTKRIAELMLTHAMNYAYEQGGISLEKFRVMDDIDLISLLRGFGTYPADIMNRIDERRLFKTISSLKASTLNKRVLTKIQNKCEKIEKEICGDFGVEEGYLLIDYPEEKSSEFKVKIEADGELKSIKEVSSLARSLESSEKEKIKVSLHAPPECARKLKKLNVLDYLT
jgi:HD superfamily phosphohydrolase